MPKWKITDMQRFERWVDRTGDCHLWQGKPDSIGYGQFGINYRRHMAHRLAWEWANGPIPDGMVVRHQCRHRMCVNVTHLELGTQKDNVHDMRRDGTSGKRLDEAQVREIKERLRSGERGADLAREFAISQMAVSDIRREKTWSWV